MQYPTPILPLPPAFAEAASRRQVEREGNRYALVRFLPLQGGGQEGDGLREILRKGG